MTNSVRSQSSCVYIRQMSFIFPIILFTSAQTHQISSCNNCLLIDQLTIPNIQVFPVFQILQNLFSCAETAPFARSMYTRASLIRLVRQNRDLGQKSRLALLTVPLGSKMKPDSNFHATFESMNTKVPSFDRVLIIALRLQMHWKT